MNEERGIRFVVFLDANSDIWVAQGLEVDVCAQGKSEQEARLNFVSTINLERSEARDRSRDLFDIGPAPQEFFDLWDDDTVASDELAVA